MQNLCHGEVSYSPNTSFMARLLRPLLHCCNIAVARTQCTRLVPLSATSVLHLLLLRCSQLDSTALNYIPPGTPSGAVRLRGVNGFDQTHNF